MRGLAGVCLAFACLGMAGGALAADVSWRGDLSYMPRDVALVTSVDLIRVHAAGVDDAMAPMRQRSLAAVSELARVAGIQLEADRIVVGLSASTGVSDRRTQVVIARGRFDAEAVARDSQAHGGVSGTYRESRVMAFGAADDGWLVAVPDDTVLVFGDASAVRAALDAGAHGEGRWVETVGVGAFVTTVASAPAWVVARSETVPGAAPVPQAVLEQLPPLDWIAAAVETEPGVRGVLSAETRDDEGAARLRDVLNGLLALARVQGAQRPEWRVVLGSLQSNVRGNVVSVSVDLTRDLLARLVGGGVLR